jgi:hypothetical protein
MTFNSRNDMQRVNGFRIEEEARRRERETQTRLAHSRNGDIPRRAGRFNSYIERIRRAFRR